MHEHPHPSRCARAHTNTSEALLVYLYAVMNTYISTVNPYRPLPTLSPSTYTYAAYNASHQVISHNIHLWLSV